MLALQKREPREKAELVHLVIRSPPMERCKLTEMEERINETFQTRRVAHYKDF